VAQRVVTVSRRIAAPAEAIWNVVRDFCGAWHPDIAWMKRERGPGGAEVRCFQAKGEKATYREQLTYFSDSDRVLHYQHIEGIAGVSMYHAQLGVNPDGQVLWRAEIEADEPRVSQIAEGSKLIFDRGLDALQHVLAGSNQFVSGTPQLAITLTGDRPGPLLVFLHGIGGSRRNWGRQVAALQDKVQCAALDLRGYGDSAIGAAQSRIGDYCDDLLRVMAHCGKEKAILCGLSYGSWMAASFAMRHPERLVGLVFSGGCTGMSEASAAEREAFLESRQKPLDAGRTPADFATEVVRTIAGPDAQEGVLGELHDAMASIPASTYRDAVWCFTHPEERLDFSRIRCPVLLMTGEFDRLASPSEIRGVAERIEAASPAPNVRFEVIAGAGHVCNIESPSTYNSLLKQFVGAIVQ
jgi:pimeloyl-ACP methyl ester carboxylesterase